MVNKRFSGIVTLGLKKYVDGNVLKTEKWQIDNSMCGFGSISESDWAWLISMNSNACESDFVINRLPCVGSRFSNDICAPKTDITKFDSICPRNKFCTRKQDREFVAGYNSIWKDILSFFGINQGVVVQSPTKKFDNQTIKMTDYAAAQYCMTCIDQTFNRVLQLIDDGPSRFLNYINPLVKSNMLSQITSPRFIHQYRSNAGFTLKPRNVGQADAEFVVEQNGVVLMANANEVAVQDTDAFNETEYVQEMLPLKFFEVYEAADSKIAMIAGISGGVAAVVVAIVVAVVVKAKKGKKSQNYKVMTVAQVKEYVL